ncbi:hypothetical protein NDI76_00435 [Halogeometricum sp. S1BR25-6]|uniref:Uncharacterized protein n=1 Tax=Halogeometricum salsisoli TaxID=2950536 RepID=A0ABU2G8Q7_9EURY|nr:hypothetical protein [Halogeometricum sp. S1BR25-6]MDS0297207.1 hypothetical protein [Halogeometricum sp. S1BR25-6]
MNSSRTRLASLGRGLGLLATLAGLAGAVGLLVYLVLPYVSVSPSGVSLVDRGGLGAENAPTVAFWAGVLAVLALLVWNAVVDEALGALSALAVLVAAFAVLTGFSIGGFVSPFALLTVCAALAFAGDRILGRGGDEDDENADAAG